MNTIELVTRFHKAFNRPINDNVFLADDELNKLRVKLLREEVTELEESLQEYDRVGVLDALTDIQYILDGTYISLGLAYLKDEAFEMVHSSNMKKLDECGLPIVREDGKILKPEGWKPPQLNLLFDSPND